MHGADSVKLVDYILIELSFIINCFLQMYPNNFIINEITGLWSWRLQNSLVEPGKVIAFTKGGVIGHKWKEQIMHWKELCKHMNMEINRSEWRKEKYFSLLILLKLIRLKSYQEIGHRNRFSLYSC